MPANQFDAIRSPRETVSLSLSKNDPSSRNWLIHRLYLRQEYKECLKLIEEILKAQQGLCEYPIYVKGLFSV
jgi:hypothetical protein